MPTPRALRVLLTGAAGFIGYHLTARLLDEGAVVHGLDNLNNYYDLALKRARLQGLQGREGFTFEQLDISDHAGVRRCFETFRPKVVIHLAAQAGVRYSLENPKAYMTANLDGFLAILEGSRHVPIEHLLYASSSSVYGANKKVPFSEDDPVDQPVSLYAATKRSNELMAYSYARLFRIPATGLRFFTVYGPWGRPDMAYFLFTKAILEGRTIDLYAPTLMRRDFTYIDDAIETIIRLISLAPNTESSSVPSRICNVGNDDPLDLKRFVSAIEMAIGRNAHTRDLPMQPGDVPATWADLTQLKALIGFAPQTSIEEGIQRFARWYRAFYSV